MSCEFHNKSSLGHDEHIARILRCLNDSAGDIWDAQHPAKWTAEQQLVTRSKTTVCTYTIPLRICRCIGDKYDWINWCFAIVMIWIHRLCHPGPLSVTQVVPQINDKVNVIHGKNVNLWKIVKQNHNAGPSLVSRRNYNIDNGGKCLWINKDRKVKLMEASIKGKVLHCTPISMNSTLHCTFPPKQIWLLSVKSGM